MGGAAASLGRSVPNLTTAASNPNAPEQLSTSNSASNLLDVDTGTQNHTAHSHPSEPRSRSSDSRLPRARRPAASPSPGRPAIFAPQRSRNQPGRIQFAAQPIRPGAGHPTGPPPLFVGPHPPSEIPLYTLDPFLPCSSRFFASQLEAITHRRPSEPQRQASSLYFCN